MSILVNGSPTKEFKVDKGDPLSPFLFLLVAEALHVVLIEAETKNIFKGLDIGDGGMLLSHLQYANDARKLVS